MVLLGLSEDCGRSAARSGGREGQPIQVLAYRPQIIPGVPARRSIGLRGVAQQIGGMQQRHQHDARQSAWGVVVVTRFLLQLIHRQR